MISVLVVQNSLYGWTPIRLQRLKVKLVFILKEEKILIKKKNKNAHSFSNV